MKSTKQLQVYEMYRIHDLLFDTLEEARKLEDGKDKAVMRFVVAGTRPDNGGFIYDYMSFKTEREANEYIADE